MTGLPLTPGLDLYSFEIDAGARARRHCCDRRHRSSYDPMQQAAYEKCNTGFDWSDRGQTLYNAIQESVANRRGSAYARKSPP